MLYFKLNRSPFIFRYIFVALSFPLCSLAPIYICLPCFRRGIVHMDWMVGATNLYDDVCYGWMSRSGISSDEHVCCRWTDECLRMREPRILDVSMRRSSYGPIALSTVTQHPPVGPVHCRCFLSLTVNFTSSAIDKKLISVSLPLSTWIYVWHFWKLAISNFLQSGSFWATLYVW